MNPRDVKVLDRRAPRSRTFLWEAVCACIDSEPRSPFGRESREVAAAIDNSERTGRKYVPVGID